MEAPTGTASVTRSSHVAHFYRDGAELAGRVGDHLAAGIRDGGVAIAIATAEHRRAVEKRMAAAGVDVRDAEARGDYLPVDAERTLRRLIVAGRPDRARFELVIGSLLHQATSDGQPVRVYGELVSLLWAAGRPAAAARLEDMWAGLGRRYVFQLMCGYPAYVAAPLAAAAGRVPRSRPG